MGKSFLLGDYSCFLKLSLEIPRGANSVKSPGESIRMKKKLPRGVIVLDFTNSIQDPRPPITVYQISLFNSFVLRVTRFRVALRSPNLRFSSS